MSVRLWSLLVWALFGAGAVFWALKLLASPQPLPAQATVAQPQESLRGDLTRLLGGDVPQAAASGAAPGPAADSRLSLVGVVSPPGSSTTDDAVALISIDGKPPRAYRVGDVVEGDRVLQSVSQRKANLGPAGQPQQLTLVIPEPAADMRGAPVVSGGMPPGAAEMPAGTEPPPQPPSPEMAAPPVQAAAPVPNNGTMPGFVPPIQR